MHGAMDNWIEVDLAQNPAQLQDFLISFPLATEPMYIDDHHLGPVPMERDGVPNPYKEEQERILRRRIREFKKMYEIGPDEK